jgi:sulfur relay (sulfurtransferase) complex TusBCD TusD component (DsrE family)
MTPPYGTERCYNALRLANALMKTDPGAEVTVFLMADAVIGAKAGQKTQQVGDAHSERVHDRKHRPNDAMILPHDANRRRITFSERTAVQTIQPRLLLLSTVSRWLGTPASGMISWRVIQGSRLTSCK